MIAAANDNFCEAALKFVGVCPGCGRPGIFLNVKDRGTHLVCHADRMFWFVSDQYYDTAPQADSFLTQRQAAKICVAYKEIQPVYPLLDGSDGIPPPEPERCA